MRFPFRLLTAGLLAALALNACAMPEAPAADDARAPTSESAFDAALAEATRPVEFMLGANRFVLPANWFVDGRGPDFQGGVTLALHWPSLEPYPPGQPYSSFTSGPMRNQRVLVTIDYIDRVPIDELPERHVTADPQWEMDSPTRNIALRDRLPDRFGLEHYVVNLDRLARHQAAILSRPPKPSENYIGSSPDWFIHRDDDGRVRTVVKCDDGREPDGEAIEGDRLVELPGSSRSPQCGSHLFSMPEYSISIRAGYSRPILRDWQGIEDTIRRALHDAHHPLSPSH